MAHSTSYPPTEQKQLLEIARKAISYGIEFGTLWQVNPENYPEHLREDRASFVTLEIDGELRGCIGNLQPVHPLVVDIANNAYAAAFGDPRFPPVSRRESEKLIIKISVLNPAEVLYFDSETHLIEQLQPGIDGLTLTAGDRSATFLPSVWDSITDPAAFVQALKMKAGMPEDYWSKMMNARRYTVEDIKQPSTVE